LFWERQNAQHRTYAHKTSEKHRQFCERQAHLSQALQEYKEMQAENAKVHTLVGAKPGQCVQMLVRLGHGEVIGKTARWPLTTKLITA
jgi:hypothetical protein